MLFSILLQFFISYSAYSSRFLSGQMRSKRYSWAFLIGDYCTRPFWNFEIFFIAHSRKVSEAHVRKVLCETYFIKVCQCSVYGDKFGEFSIHRIRARLFCWKLLACWRMSAVYRSCCNIFKNLVEFSVSELWVVNRMPFFRFIF